MRRFKQYNDSSLNDSFLQEVNSKGKPIGKPISKKQKGKIYNDIEGFLNNSNNSNYQLFGGSGQRMAGQVFSGSQKEIDTLLKPWNKYEIDDEGPNFHGRTRNEWIKDNNRVREELLLADAKQANRAALNEILRANGFTNDLENNNIINYLHNKKVLHTEDIWVPGAAADEELSKAILDYSGFTPVSLENAKGDPMATDLSAFINGKTQYVDAQIRQKKDRSMPLEMTLRRSGAFDVIKRNPGMTLRELTELMAEEYPGIIEGKFLHTNNPDFNRILSRKLAEGGETHMKDYIISSARPGSTKKSIYDKEKPYDWDMLDLNKAREILLPLTRQQMFDKYGITLSQGRFGGATLLNMPEEFIKKELADRRNPINLEAKSFLINQQ